MKIFLYLSCKCFTEHIFNQQRKLETFGDTLTDGTADLFPSQGGKWALSWCSSVRLCIVQAVWTKGDGSSHKMRHKKRERVEGLQLQVVAYFGGDDRHDKELCCGTLILTWKGDACVSRSYLCFLMLWKKGLWCSTATHTQLCTKAHTHRPLVHADWGIWGTNICFIFNQMCLLVFQQTCFQVRD